ncbi:MAG: ABC transporter ATP-binding protein [Actinobacteria bacterium]|nr:ABC transporter ATP-binding protein [Actinomycetota bacterium]
MARVVFDHVTKRFGDVVAVDDMSLEVFDQEFLVLLGPSGCGKSTALRMVAGLEDPTEGTITIGDRVVNDVEAKDRDIAMVFQTYALYPHMSVRKNIEFPLRTRKVAPDQRTSLVMEAAESLGLEKLLDRKPAQLSGGQRQRVALARAIVRRPQAFLMDEPLSNLDAKLRVQTRAELIELQRELATTVIYVTHDQVEAMTMGNRIAIMADGLLHQVGPPQAVYEKPANLFVARFIGNPPMQMVAGPVVRIDGQLGVAVEHTVLPLPPEHQAAIERTGVQSVVIGVRPEHLQLGSDGVLPATVSVVESLGHERHVICRLDDEQMVISRQPSDQPAPGEGSMVRLVADPAHLHLYDAETERRIETDGLPPITPRSFPADKARQ